jgi:hypothetical protein
VQALYEAGECQRVAAEASERHGLAIVVGWCLDFDGNLCWHCANVDAADQLVDAGRDHHRPGLVGKVLDEFEASVIRRAAGQRTGAELRERGGSLLASLLG